MANLDKLIENIHNYQRRSDIDEFKSELLKGFLYFFLINDGSFKQVTEIVWTGKERPVNVPLINEEGETYGVLYTNKRNAMNSKEDRFVIASMKGPKALELMRGIKNLTQVIIQGNGMFVYLDRSSIDEILNKA